MGTPTSIEVRRFGLAKETTRGTAVTPAAVWMAVDKDSEIDFTTKLIEDPALRGVNARFPAIAGPQMAQGHIKAPVRAQNIGEFLRMAIGAPSSAQQGVTTAYKHTFTPASTIQLPSYTFHLDRGLSVKKYNLGVVSKLKFSGAAEGLVLMDAEVMAQNEASGDIGTPTYAEAGQLEFFHTTVKFAGSAPSTPIVKSWSVELDPGVIPFRPLNQTQYPADFLARGPYKVSGDMVLYFEDETERAKFIAATNTTLEFVIDGANIASSYDYMLDILCSQVRYKAFPFGDEDGLLGAKVKWEAYYDTSTSAIAVVYIINTKTTY